MWPLAKRCSLSFEWRGRKWRTSATKLKITWVLSFLVKKCHLFAHGIHVLPTTKKGKNNNMSDTIKVYPFIFIVVCVLFSFPVQINFATRLERTVCETCVKHVLWPPKEIPLCERGKKLPISPGISFIFYWPSLELCEDLFIFAGSLNYNLFQLHSVSCLRCASFVKSI